MAGAAARACMHANYQEASDKVSWELDEWLWSEALDVADTHYLTRIEEKAAAMGIPDCEEKFDPELEKGPSWEDRWTTAVLGQEWSPSEPYLNGSQSSMLAPELTFPPTLFEYPDAITQSTVGRVLLHACVADESIRPTPAEGELDLEDILGASIPSFPRYTQTQHVTTNLQDLALLCCDISASTIGEGFTR
ncbi:hypothetical protein BJX70DRAFT_404613 [Aspergillus crustosus]